MITPNNNDINCAIRVTPTQVDNISIRNMSNLYKEHLKWDVTVFQHAIKVVPYNGLEDLGPLWKDTNFRSWMYKLISTYPQYLFFLEDNEKGVDLALACLGTVVNSRNIIDGTLINNLYMEPKMKQFLVDSLETLMQEHNVPLKSIHGLYMKILAIPNKPLRSGEN
ncbi:hypothetical protein [Rummeliibacillus stabekisii]|uniref:hypothetical protein n=1 Tax=Rummeliibacillus stabekisii TaxID=241244 RepID=UPI001169A693|nr:hypothetical protein [Rummeliibacillus stabekisii]MBB5171636.1 hypothetical protein [Rummeliibacillus stabekisii]GEL05483.1 hypothetical protein RST01_21100 [Rummeliibacillus stabekisii]